MNSIGLENDYNSSTSVAGLSRKATTAALLIGISAGIFDVSLTAPKLIKNGLTENMTSSRPDHIPGERQRYTHRSSARSLLKHATGWAGDDLNQLLSDIYEARGEAEF